MTKLCPGCNLLLALDDFPKIGARYRQGICRSCYRATQRARYAMRKAAKECVECSRPASDNRIHCSLCHDRRRKTGHSRGHENKARAIAYLGGACHDCGFQSPVLSVFDFHHRDGRAESPLIGRLLFSTCSWERIQTELDRCQLVCGRCHRIRTWPRSERSSKRRAIAYLEGSCWDCGFVHESIAAYDFHHTDPSKKEHPVSVLLKRTSRWESIQTELDKCELLCVNCHRVRTWPHAEDDIAPRDRRGPKGPWRHTDPACRMCPKCHQEKAMDEFYRRPNGQPQSWCKKCKNHCAR